MALKTSFASYAQPPVVKFLSFSHFSLATLETLSLVRDIEYKENCEEENIIFPVYVQTAEGEKGMNFIPILFFAPQSLFQQRFLVMISIIYKYDHKNLYS